MSMKKDKPQFHQQLLLVSFFVLAFAMGMPFLSPTVQGWMGWIAVACFVFGLTFGTTATIAARRRAAADKAARLSQSQSQSPTSN